MTGKSSSSINDTGIGQLNTVRKILTGKKKKLIERHNNIKIERLAAEKLMFGHGTEL